jgi:hypothetical protein
LWPPGFLFSWERSLPQKYFKNSEISSSIAWFHFILKYSILLELSWYEVQLQLDFFSGWLSLPNTIYWTIWAEDEAQVVECLPSKCKVLSSNSTKKLKLKSRLHGSSLWSHLLWE